MNKLIMALMFLGAHAMAANPTFKYSCSSTVRMLIAEGEFKTFVCEPTDVEVSMTLKPARPGVGSAMSFLPKESVEFNCGDYTPKIRFDTKHFYNSSTGVAMTLIVVHKNEVQKLMSTSATFQFGEHDLTAGWVDGSHGPNSFAGATVACTLIN